VLAVVKAINYHELAAGVLGKMAYYEREGCYRTAGDYDDIRREVLQDYVERILGRSLTEAQIDELAQVTRGADKMTADHLAPQIERLLA
jgi:hypothetical protein